MSIISRLLGGQTRVSKSVVREWADQQFQMAQRNPTVSLAEELFTTFVYALSRFVPSRGTKCSDNTAPFLNDCALFELGCYFFALVENWLTRNHAQAHQVVTECIATNFIGLFTSVGIPDAQNLFHQRIEGFRNLRQETKNPLSHHNVVCQLLLRTKDNNRPTTFAIDGTDGIIISGIENMSLTNRITEWYAVHCPNYMKCLETVLDKWAVTKNPSKMRET
jgi:hypothetical protein